MNKTFSNKINKDLTEVYRRLNYFSDGNVNEPLLLLSYPSNVKEIKVMGFIKPYSTETPRGLNWYSLTEKGKKFFSNYINKIDEDTNLAIFEGRYVKDFDIELWNSL